MRSLFASARGEDERVGPEAKKLFQEAKDMLARASALLFLQMTAICLQATFSAVLKAWIVKEGLLKCSGVDKYVAEQSWL